MEQQSATLVTQIGYFHRADGHGIVSTTSAEVRQAPAEVVRMAQPATRPRAVARKAGLGSPGKATRPAAAPAARQSAPLARASGDDSSWSDF